MTIATLFFLSLFLCNAKSGNPIVEYLLSVPAKAKSCRLSALTGVKSSEADRFLVPRRLKDSLLPYVSSHNYPDRLTLSAET